ncbi:D-alanine--D-alanine ligase [Spartinivicinus ruber]|uniref:D-alanine--D-alanine ligase n=1 Tax=Spartinivicinus ruber TaxID=2683272 RepID=UPI0013D28610|nr:D-alanine--D-alanine ligase [Spartinivicinus ruber]
MNNQFGHVAVLYGGLSAERDVSLKSGREIYQALIDVGVDASLVDVGKNVVQQLQDIKPIDIAFIALHGRGGEDGTLQALLEFLEIPYTGSGVLASALAMDKYRSKLLWQGLGLPTPMFQLFQKSLQTSELSPKVTFPCVLKPAKEGSSIGITKVNTAEDFSAALATAQQFDDDVLAEPWITGAEFTVAILNGQALPPIELKTDRTFYDYEAKYIANDTQYICPCNLSLGKQHELKKLALEAFYSLGCEGWGRVDVMQDQAGDFWLLEVNTIPGMTDHSLVPMAAKEAGYSFSKLVLEILATTQ